MARGKILKIGVPVAAAGVIVVIVVAFILLQPQGNTCSNTTPPTFTEEGNFQLEGKDGGFWSVPVFDGTHLVVSSETRENITARKFYLNLTPVGDAVEVANKSDCLGLNISDHKHIFQNNYHFIVFSSSGTGSGGHLFLIKFDVNFNRIANTTVVANEDPTNDMLLVGDGTYINVGKFVPGTGHKILRYDEDLNWQSNYTEGGGDNIHANGAAATFFNNQFYVVAPQYVGPGANGRYYRLVYDSNWNIVQARTTILEDAGNLGLITALSTRDDQFIVHYCRGSSGGNPIARAVFDCNWNLLKNETAYMGALHVPHTVIVNDDIFLGYGNETMGFRAHIAKFSMT